MTVVNERQLGLRERKRRATENAIETAAVGIALAEGPDAVTVERICEQAFVSRSTFFNYFPTRDSAIYGRPIELQPSERVDELLNEWAHALPIGVGLAVLEGMGVDHINADVARARLELARRYPEHMTWLDWEVAGARQRVRAVVADWFARHPEHQRLGDPNADASAVTMIASLLGEEIFVRWVSGTGDRAFDLEEMRSAYDVVRSRVAAYSG